jgi:hypothetical protein
MPEVTLRMVELTRLWNSEPRSPNSRLANERATAVALGAFASSAPEMRMEKKNYNTVRPMPADAVSRAGRIIFN